ncbi:MAG: glycerol kinase GlpK [Desulfobacterales bacterium]|nr:glycerol kinase GlpK [Desulfobacterales bacterium]
MFEKYIMGIDEGTTGTRVLIVDSKSRIKAQAYSEIGLNNPSSDRVEQDAGEIWEKSYSMALQALKEADLTASDIAAIGITNQRATTIVWDRKTGDPITPAIVWQDSRTASYIENIRTQWADKVHQHTGWALAPVYSSLSLRWIMENVPDARERANAGDLAFGTIDSWLIYKLTGGKVHTISASNASVTGAYDLINDCWYSQWLDFLGLPMELFPEICDDSGMIGLTDKELFGAQIPITGAIADQHAALFAQGCIETGTVKCTHGTGTFLDMNIGSKMAISENGLNTIIAWRKNGETTYGFEGYAAVTGSAVQWLRDGVEMIKHSSDTESIAQSVPDNGGVYFVPALTGLSAPYWDSFARGMIIGISRQTKLAHLVRATLEGIVFATKDFLETMRKDSGVEIKSINVDGGASLNSFLVQFQADMLNAEVIRPRSHEATGLGAVYMAGLAIGYWDSPKACFENQAIDRIFKPRISDELRDQLSSEWEKAVKRCMGWLQ